MNKTAKIAYTIAALLGNAMCAVVAYQYCELQYGAPGKGYSAPPNAAFMWVVPFGIGIFISLFVAVKNSEKTKNDGEGGSEITE